MEQADPHHMSAEDVYKRLIQQDESVGLATVYRVLTQFEAAGLVTRHNFEGGHSIFELDDGEHHDHMVCVESGEVVEFLLKTKAVGFIVDQDNVAVGLRVQNLDSGAFTDIRARRFLMSCGDFVSNREMMSEYLPRIARYPCGTSSREKLPR